MIIALTGYAGSGKSTAARHLVEQHGFTLVKFAGPLKNMMRCLGLGDRHIEGDLKEQPHPVLSGRTPRYAMQTLGTEWGRNLIGESVWVDVAMWHVDAALAQGGRVVIDDCRFQNEARAVRYAGGRVVEVLRPGVEPVNGHVSEQIPEPDIVVMNGGDINALHASLDRLL